MNKFLLISVKFIIQKVTVPKKLYAAVSPDGCVREVTATLKIIFQKTRTGRSLPSFSIDFGKRLLKILGSPEMLFLII